jgi:3-oxoacyl-[acyl-carrier-protein] synthase II
MGSLASELADLVIITSDSPGREDPAAISAEVARGIRRGNFRIILDRRRAVAAAMRHALDAAGVAPEDVGCIRAQATSTRAGDAAEARAIRRLFGAAARRVPVTANKSMLGHMLGAAGAVAAVALVRTVQEGIVPPTINLEHPDPDCELDHVALRPRRVDGVLVGVSNSFAFGGHNSVLVIRRSAA